MDHGGSTAWRRMRRISLSRNISICNVRRMKPINAQIKDNIADFLKTRSLYVIRVLRAAESVRDRKKISHVIACKHIRHSMVSQSPCTNDCTPNGLYVQLWCNASCITKWKARRGYCLSPPSLFQEIHSTREIAPSRTKRNGSRRFYYTALKPGRLPLQSYGSKLGAF